MKTLVTLVLAIAGTASAQFASDTFSGSATAQINTNLAAGAFGLNLELDNLDVPSTTVAATGSAAIFANEAQDSLALAGLQVDVDDLFIGGISDSDSDTIRFFGIPLAGATVSATLNEFSSSNLSISLVNPTSAVAFVGLNQVTFTNVELALVGDFAIDFSASLVGTGLASAIGTINLPIMETFSIDTTLVLPTLTLDLVQNGNQLALGGFVDIGAIIPDDLFPITKDDLLPGTPLGDAIPPEFADILALLETLTIDATISATAQFNATFTIPAPGVAGLAVFGGLLAARRRR